MAHGEKLKAFWEKLKVLFHKVDEYLQAHVDLAISITTKIKAALNSPVAVLITDLIPGTIDDKIKQKAIAALELTIDALQIVKECEGAATPEEKLFCYIDHIQTLPILVQHAMLAKFASTFTGFMDDNKEPEHLYDLVIQQNYSATKPV